MVNTTTKTNQNTVRKNSLSDFFAEIDGMQRYSLLYVLYLLLNIAIFFAVVWFSGIYDDYWLLINYHRPKTNFIYVLITLAIVSTALLSAIFLIKKYCSNYFVVDNNGESLSKCSKHEEKQYKFSKIYVQSFSVFSLLVILGFFLPYNQLRAEQSSHYVEHHEKQWRIFVNSLISGIESVYIEQGKETLFTFSSEVIVENVWGYREALDKGLIFNCPLDWHDYKKILGEGAKNHSMFTIKGVPGYFAFSDEKLSYFTDICVKDW